MVLQTNASLTSAPMMNKKYTIPFVLLFTTLALGKDLCDVDSGDYSFTLGEWSVSVLRDGDFKNPESFVLQPAFIVQHFFDFYYPGVTPTASFNPVLLRKDKEVFLFDSGNAVGRVPTAGLLISQLESVGVKPEDVTRIFITHAHPDHTGGLVASNGGRVYPNARIYVSVVENDFWTLPYPEIQKQIPDVPEVFINSTFEAYNAAAKAYGNRIQKINDRETPIPGIQALFTPGDTPGHTSYRISSGKKTLTIFGDVVLGRVSFTVSASISLSLTVSFLLEITDFKRSTPRVESRC